VRITREGMVELSRFQSEYSSNKQLQAQFKTARHYLVDRIRNSRTLFYYQVPLVLSHEPCTLADFRTVDEVTFNLSEFVASGEEDIDWT